MAVMSSSAFADSTGTQTFKANIVTNTCTIANLNQTQDLGNLLKSQFATPWAASSGYKNNFNVTNCPTTFTKVKVTPTFKASSQYDWVVENAGTAKGVHLNTQFVASDTVNRWENGKAREFTLNKGDAVVPVNFKIERNNSDTVTDGTLDYRMAFTFDFA
ncbi:hypothetical protein GTL85_003888 [Salmonella enterica]|nr:hypothetical protein [Salmonella enterica]EDS4669495.1 hypothetical protein [Salmonella enterica]